MRVLLGISLVSVFWLAGCVEGFLEIPPGYGDFAPSSDDVDDTAPLDSAAPMDSETGPKGDNNANIPVSNNGQDSETDRGVEPAPVDTDDSPGPDTGPDTGQYAGEDTGQDTGQDPGVDTGVDTGQDTSQPSNCDGVPEWVGEQTYAVGDHVVCEGKLFECTGHPSWCSQTAYKPTGIYGSDVWTSKGDC